MKEIGVSSSSSMMISKYIFFGILITIPILLFLSHRNSCSSTLISTTTTSILDLDLKIRPGYATYDSYLKKQLNKTLNPKLRKIWTTRDWDRKIQVFSKFFSELKNGNLLSDSSKVLCIGARMGQKVEALKHVGISDSVGMDLVPYLPWVVKGDFHNQLFDDEMFDLEFSDVFDHTLFPEKFVSKIEWTLKSDGFCVLHVALSKQADKYSVNDLYSIEPLKKLFKWSELVHIRTVDGFNLDTEVVFRKTR